MNESFLQCFRLDFWDLVEFLGERDVCLHGLQNHN